jgi:hypothetical protein
MTSVLHFTAFIIWEWKFAKQPILPFDIWVAPSFAAMVTVTFFIFMAVGIGIWYITIWNSEIRGYTLFANGGAFATLAVCGAIAAVASGKIIRYIPAEYIMATGGLASVVSLTLVATQPPQQTYWAQTFPALIVMALGPDFTFTAAQIIASNAVKRKHQGIAGSLIGTLASYGLSTGLGFAATVEAYTSDGGRDEIAGFRHALYLGIGLAVAAILISIALVRIPKDTRDGWDEDEEDVPETEVKPRG